jgi:hypothetical protein
MPSTSLPGLQDLQGSRTQVRLLQGTRNKYSTGLQQHIFILLAQQLVLSNQVIFSPASLVPRCGIGRKLHLALIAAWWSASYLY